MEARHFCIEKRLCLLTFHDQITLKRTHPYVTLADNCVGDLPHEMKVILQGKDISYNAGNHRNQIN